MTLYQVVETEPHGEKVLYIARATITKQHRLGGIQSHSERGLKSKIEMLAGLVSSEPSLLGLLTATSHCVLL